MSNKPLPQVPQSPKDEKSLNDLSSSDEKDHSINNYTQQVGDEKDHSTNNYTQQVGTNNHPHLTAVKEVVSGAVHNATQVLKIPKESHPEAYHQDGKSGPE